MSAKVKKYNQHINIVQFWSYSRADKSYSCIQGWSLKMKDYHAFHSDAGDTAAVV